MLYKSLVFLRHLDIIWEYSESKIPIYKIHIILWSSNCIMFYLFRLLTGTLNMMLAAAIYCSCQTNHGIVFRMHFMWNNELLILYAWGKETFERGAALQQCILFFWQQCILPWAGKCMNYLMNDFEHEIWGRGCTGLLGLILLNDSSSLDWPMIYAENSIEVFGLPYIHHTIGWLHCAS